MEQICAILAPSSNFDLRDASQSRAFRLRYLFSDRPECDLRHKSALCPQKISAAPVRYWLLTGRAESPCGQLPRAPIRVEGHLMKGRLCIGYIGAGLMVLTLTIRTMIHAWSVSSRFSAPETPPFRAGRRRAFLRLDVALDGFKGCAAGRSGEIRGRPEDALVIASSNIRPRLSQHSAGCALRDVDQSRDRHLGRIFDQHVNVIGFTVAGDQPIIHGLADLTEMLGKPVQCGAIEYAASILGDTDQMHGKKRNAMSAASKVFACSLTDQP